MKKDQNEVVEATVEESKEIVLKEVQFKIIASELDVAIDESDGIAEINLESETLNSDYSLVYDTERKFANIRISAKKHADSLTAPANKFKKLVKEEYEKILKKLEPHEKLFKEQRTIVEDHKAKIKAEKAEAEQKRMAEINAKMDAIRNLPFELIGTKASYIKEVIDTKVNVTNGVDLSEEDYGEFVEMAKQLILATNQKLVTMYDEAFIREKKEIEAKELADKQEADAKALAEKNEAEAKAEAEKNLAIQKQKDEEYAQLKKEKEESDAKLKKIEDEKKAKEQAESKAKQDKIDEEKAVQAKKEEDALHAQKSEEYEKECKEKEERTIRDFMQMIGIERIEAEKILRFIKKDKISHVQFNI